ncbi:MAG TPA: hypothetical protein VNE39_17020 [Planctomycetota bacterium]|nr:hypothetical protein [Planctomycetota bacterium]
MSNAALQCLSRDGPLRQGPNTVVLKLASEIGTAYGGWAFAFQAAAPDGVLLLPEAVS